MNEVEILSRILLCLAFGTILGLESETRNANDSDVHVRKPTERLGGLRTYVILTLFGGLAGILFTQGYPIFSYLMFTAVFLVVLTAYILNVQHRRAFGVTTEISILIAVLISFAATADIVPLQLLLVIALVLALILSQKRGIGALISKVGHNEIEDIVKFLIVVFVVWPFLPDKTFYLADLPNADVLTSSLGISSQLAEGLALANPYRLWLYILLISGINLFGYFAGRAIGQKRAQTVAAAFGGLASSTAAVVAFAGQAKKKSGAVVQHLAGLGLLANSASFIFFALIASSISGFFAIVKDINWALLLSSLVIAVVYLVRPHSKKDVVNYDVKYEPFSIGPAVKFVLLLSAVRIVVQLIDFYFGDAGFVIATSLSGLIGVDVAIISIGETWAAGRIPAAVAAGTFLTVNIVNYAAKTFYGYIQGNRLFAKWLGFGLLVSAAIAIAVFVL